MPRLSKRRYGWLLDTLCTCSLNRLSCALIDSRRLWNWDLQRAQGPGRPSLGGLRSAVQRAAGTTPCT
jgi:hypothetical protein